MAKKKVEPVQDLRTTKILCHPEGHPFAAWHREHKAYAMYFTDQDEPATAESLQINGGGITDHSTLVWCPVIQIVEKPDDEVVFWGGIYDTETGESL